MKMILALVLIAGVTSAASVPIRNDTVWKDDRGQEIMCHGGSLCQFGETFYFYGWGDYPGDNRKDTITRLTPDYLKLDRAICEVPLTGDAREAPYITKLKGRYWLFVSGHGVGGSAWNGSPTSYTTAEKLEGPWTPFKKMACEPESKDCFNAQNDFLFEVHGSAGSFVLWGGDRWPQRTGTGVGKNVWLPLHWKGDEPLLKWYPTWNVDTAAGTWTADPKATGNQP